MLDIRLFIDYSNSLSDILATNTKATLEAELQYKAPSQRQGIEQVPLVIHENRYRELVAANISELVRSSSLALPLGQNIRIKEPLLQAYQVPISYEVSLILLTSTKPLNYTTQLNNVLLDLQLEEGSVLIFHYNYDDISRNLNKAKLIQLLSNLRVRRKGYFKLVVRGLPPLNIEEAYFNQLGKSYYMNFSY